MNFLIEILDIQKQIPEAFFSYRDGLNTHSIVNLRIIFVLLDSIFTFYTFGKNTRMKNSTPQNQNANKKELIFFPFLFPRRKSFDFLKIDLRLRQIRERAFQRTTFSRHHISRRHCERRKAIKFRR